MKTFFYLTAFVLLISFRLSAQDGEKLFKSNCAACHTIGDGRLTGPDLKKVHDRHNEAWLLKWVKSSQTLVKANDTSAVRLFNENKKIVMPDQSMNEEEIKAILGYIKTVSDAPAPVAAAPAPKADAAATPASGDAVSSSPSFTMGEYILFAVCVFMTFVIWGLARAVRALSAYNKTKS